MALKRIRQELRNYFLTGLRPTEENFAELIESNLNILEDKATLADIETGTDIEKYVTPEGARKAVEFFVPTASTTVKGIAEISTLAEVETGTDSQRFVTPEGAKRAVRKHLTVNGLAPDLATGDIQVTTITGNSATATKLAFARTINGVAFDGSQNIVIPSSPRIIRIVGSTPIPLDNINTNQNISFTSINLEANKTYSFKGKYFLTTGPVQHSTSIGFSGTSQIASMEYVVRVFASAVNSITGSQTVGQFSTNSMKVINSATSTATIITIEFEGMIRTGALAGTFIPQIKFSANPTGTNNLKNGTYIELNELGSDTIQSLG